MTLIQSRRKFYKSLACRNAVFLLALAVGMSIGMAHARAASLHNYAGATVRSVEWSLSSIEGQRTISLLAKIDHCVGNPKPQIQGVKVAWRRHTATIRLLVRFPATGEDETCGGIRLRMSKRFKLERSVVGLSLYDGSTSPPSLRS
jgi:hypothetical protein